MESMLDGILDEDERGITFIVHLKGNECSEMRELLQDDIQETGYYEKIITRREPLSELSGAQLYMWSFGIELSEYFEGSCAVQDIERESPAECDGRLKIGDCIVEVNDVPVGRFMHKKKALLSGDTMKLKALRCSSRLISHSTLETAKGLKRSKDDDIVFDVRGEEIKSFRSLITAHSPVLEGMFAHNTVEKATGRIKVDFDPKAFQAVLSFLGTGSLKPLEMGHRHLLEIAQIADYYGIKAIGEELRSRIHLCKSQKTTVEMAVTAFELGLAKEDFIKPLLMYIAMWWPEIKETQTHVLVTSHPELLVELCNCIHEEREGSRKFFSRLDDELRPQKYATGFNFNHHSDSSYDDPYEEEFCEDDESEDDYESEHESDDSDESEDEN